MKRLVSFRRCLAVGAGTAFTLLFAAAVSADPVVRVATFTVAGVDKQEEVLKLNDQFYNLYAASKGFQWYQPAYDPSTGQNVLTSLWDSREDMERVVKPNAFRQLAEQTEPWTKKDLSVRVYQAQKLKKN